MNSQKYNGARHEIEVKALKHRTDPVINDG